MKNYKIFLCEDYWDNRFLLGDIDQDGYISSADTRALLKYVNTPYEITEKQKLLMDINKDGKITSEDVELCMKMASGELPLEKISIDNETYLSSRIVAEIGSSTSQFAGKAIDPVFHSKLDGTHNLTFQLAKYYYDEELGEQVLNEITEEIVNKSKILVIDTDTNKEFHLVVNERTDIDKNGELTFSYSCDDAYIEELSKTGYNISFDKDDPESGALGTIDELSKKILKDSGWDYDEKESDNLYEYKIELQYNSKQQRYDTVQVPVPAHPIEYIPEVETYCNKLDVIKESGGYNHPVYCYEDTEQITSNTVQNILYNADTFLDLTGWTSYEIVNGSVRAGHQLKTEKITVYENDIRKDKYVLKISPRTEKKTFMLLNDTPASANKTIAAEQPYLLKIKYANDLNCRGINSINFYKENPLTNSNYNKEPAYSLFYDWGNSNTHVDEKSTFIDTRYYVIKTKQSIVNPYITFGIAAKDTDVLIESIQLFELKGRETKDDKGNVLTSSNENYLELLSKLTNGCCIDEGTGEIKTPASKGFVSIYKDKNYLNLITLMENSSTISAYTHKKILYFIRDNYDENSKKISPDKEDTLTYLDFKTEVADGKTIIQVNDLPDGKPTDTTAIYELTTDGKYYQYYELIRNGVVGGDWDLALLGDGVTQKRRTLNISKSNRFNLLQELSELFKARCVFNIKTLENGRLKKTVYFKENAIRQNFSGFHKGVNLADIERKVDSNEIVTKMFVEDIDSNFSKDGFVTIRTSSHNPWGENFYYNFKYYIEQGLLDGTKTEEEKEDLYTAVKGKNIDILDLSDKMASSAIELNDLQGYEKSLSYSIASLYEEQISLEADKTDYAGQLAQPDLDNINSRLAHIKELYDKYDTERKEIQTRYKTLKEEYDSWRENVEKLQEEKEELIYNFEQKYSQYIKEGVWSDSSYADNDTYFFDSQKVSETSAMPKMTWKISVIDGAAYEELKDFEFEVGDQTFVIDNDFFDKKEDKEHYFEVLISGIKEHLDDRTKNEIEVRNYSTNFDDLFQRISAATQTLELNEQIYNRAANFTPNNQVDTTILQNTLLNNSLILANASDNSTRLDENGLFLQSVINPSKKLLAVADGIFVSNSTRLSDGAPEWKTGITADGINASLLTAGQIDTSLIKIFSNGQPSFSWGELGITAYDTSFRLNPDSSKQETIAVIGDSYSINRENGTLIGWIDRLKNKGFSVIGEGVGGAGFLPYYHLYSKEKDYNYYFITQLRKILNQGQRPKYILIAGGFNDRNMCVNDMSSDGNYTNNSIKTLKEVFPNNSYTDIIGVPSGSGQQGYYLYNPYSADNPDGNLWTNEADGTKLVEQINQVQELLTSTYGVDNRPTVILVTMGRYSERYLAGSKAMNKIMLKQVYELYERTVSGFENWKYVDISGILSDDLNNWVEDAGGYEIAFTSDNVHPTNAGLEAITNLLVKTLYSVDGLKSIYKSVQDGDAFVRLDKYGLYSVDNNENFNYDAAGIPWYQGLSTEQALSKIQKNATFSITNKGFHLNVKNEGTITLGNLDADGSYGLRITDDSGKSIVQLQNKGDNTIAGWRISERSLLNKHEITVIEEGKKVKKNALFYLNNGQGQDYSPNITVLAIGYTSTGAGDTTEANFRVTMDGVLHAKGAEFFGSTLAGLTINEKSLVFKSEPFTSNNVEYLNLFGIQTSTGTSYNALAIGSVKTGAEGWATAPFRVTNKGKLYATEADIEGKIKATTGSFSESVTIEGTTITAGKLKKLFNSATNGEENVTVIKNIEAEYGSIGGWIIGKTNLSSKYYNTDSKNGISLQPNFPRVAAMKNQGEAWVSLGVQDKILFEYDNKDRVTNVPAISFFTKDAQFTSSWLRGNLYLIDNYGPVGTNLKTIPLLYTVYAPIANPGNDGYDAVSLTFQIVGQLIDEHKIKTADI